jgi:hypothetical protein
LSGRRAAGLLAHWWPLGVDSIDAVLPGGGLALGAVHEICEQGTDGSRASLATLFAASILARLPGPVLWRLHSRQRLEVIGQLTGIVADDVCNS